MLRRGMVKLVRSTRDGRERIVRVLRSGNFDGLEALTGVHYDSDAIALTPVTVSLRANKFLNALRCC